MDAGVSFRVLTALSAFSPSHTLAYVFMYVYKEDPQNHRLQAPQNLAQSSAPDLCSGEVPEFLSARCGLETWGASEEREQGPVYSCLESRYTGSIRESYSFS